MEILHHLVAPNCMDACRSLPVELVDLLQGDDIQVGSLLKQVQSSFKKMTFYTHKLLSQPLTQLLWGSSVHIYAILLADVNGDLWHHILVSDGIEKPDAIYRSGANHLRTPSAS